MKKSYFFKFFVFALVGALAILPSCKDYDDDISGLETSVSTVKSDLTALQSSVSSAQSAATAAQSTATDALAKANEALAAAQAAGDAEAIAALETQVEGLVAQIADINEELETLAGLEARIEALMAELEAANAAQLEAIVADVEAITAELSEMVAPITSMTLIPDLVSEDGSLPILDYSVLITGCEYGIAPAKTIRFYVNPSNAKEASIDKENLMVYHNAPMIRSTDAIGQSAEFVSLEDGILSVRVSVDVNKLGATPGTIDQVLLEVPFVNGGSVKSDWVRVETTEFTNEDLALVSSPLATGQTWAEKELSTTLAAAQALTYTDAPVVKLTYDGTIDLATVVKTMTNSPWADFNVEDYGLTYEYAIKNGTVDIDADNKYISLAGSVVTSKVFEVDGENPEAKDRMPIVHVRLLANAGEENECEIL
jgi:prefoldin subunit 5